jgi:2,3-bisphosphoglycerate-dependent phosphoglycerate mutase
MSYLYLIRHPRTHVDPNRQSHEWVLSDSGRIELNTLAHAPFWNQVAAVYSSPQTKAIEPARVIGDKHNISVATLPGLAEVWRGTDPYLGTEEFNAALSAYFSESELAIAGWERPTDATQRFKEAVQEIVTEHPADSVALLSHGTILTLYTAMLDSEAPNVVRWRSIQPASVAAVDVQTMRLVSGFISAPYKDVPIA